VIDTVVCCVEGEEEGQQEEQEYSFEDRNRKFIILGDGEYINLENEEKDIVIVAKPEEKNKLKIEFYARDLLSAYKAKEIANNFVNNGERVEHKIFKNNYEDRKLKKVCELKYPPNLILEQAIEEKKEKEIIKDCILKLYENYPDNHLKYLNNIY